MATSEAKLIAAVCDNNDMPVILAEPREIFGSYGDVFSFMTDYYSSYGMTPTRALLEERFKDIALPPKGDTSAATEHYLDALRNSYLQSRLESILLSAGAAIDKMSPAHIYEKLSKSLAELGKYTVGSNDLNLNDAERAEEHFRKLREANDAGLPPGIPTGCDAIDVAYPTGMAPGHYIVLFGYTGKMKSLWSAWLLINAWIQGKRVLVFSLEMTPEEYRDRVYTILANGDFLMSDFSRGSIDKDRFNSWADEMLKDKTDFVVVSTKGLQSLTPRHIQAKIDMYKPDLCCVDYLQLMSDNAGTQQMTPRMMSLSRELKMLATANQIPLIAISAVTDTDNDKRDAPPTLSQISWSSAIEYDANLAIAVHRHDDTGDVEIVGRKNRVGDLFSCIFSVDANSGVWVEQY